MARPRVFISSTFYDLKHVRASLEVFVESLGFDAVLFEKGDIAYHPDQALDESCYREAKAADIFVLIVGGRYGSAASDGELTEDEPHRLYDSVTRREFDAAQGSRVPTFVLVEASVHAEYSTFRKNRDNTTVRYAHVDDVAVFKLIEWIYSKSNNNPVYTFERATDISGWLREQWSGLFRELLHSRSQQQQLADLSAQVYELSSLNNTFKTYLEAVLLQVSPENSNKIIDEEHRRLNDELINANLAKNTLYSVFVERESEPGMLKRVITDAESWPSLRQKLITAIGPDGARKMASWLREYREARNDLDRVRSDLGRPLFEWPQNWVDRPQDTDTDKGSE